MTSPLAIKIGPISFLGIKLSEPAVPKGFFSFKYLILIPNLSPFLKYFIIFSDL